MKTLRLILSVSVLLSFYSCENFDWFKTDNGLNKDLQGTWKREFLGDENIDYEEDWNFTDGKVIITRAKNSTTDTVDIGSFEADGKLTVSYLKINGLTKDSTLIQYNNKWTITQLDSKILYLAADYKKGGGVLQREFYKK